MNINHTEESVTAQNARYKLYLFSIFPYIDGSFPKTMLFFLTIIAYFCGVI